MFLNTFQPSRDPSTLAGTAGASRMAPPARTRISARLKCVQEHVSRVNMDPSALHRAHDTQAILGTHACTSHMHPTCMPQPGAGQEHLARAPFGEEHAKQYCAQITRKRTQQNNKRCSTMRVERCPRYTLYRVLCILKYQVLSCSWHYQLPVVP